MRAGISGSLRRLSYSRAEKVAFTRFFRNERVRVDEMLEASSARTAEVVAGRHVALIEDTSEINYQSKAGRKRDLGRVGNGTDLGLFIHPALAVDAKDGSVLGIAGAKVWRRKKKKKQNYQSLPIEKKESYRWIETARSTDEVLVSAAVVTEIKDREGDIYEVFARPCPPNVRKLVRATHNRALADDGRLFDRVATKPEAGRFALDIPARPGRSARRTTLAVRFAKAELRQPRLGADKRDPKSVALNIVEVCEIDPPARKEAVHWRLLTTHDIETLEDAMEVVRLYRLRWTIEQLFRTLKSNAFDIEASFLQDGDALERLVVAALIAATQALQLVYARGDAGRNYQATRVFTADEVAFLAVLVKTLQGKTQKQKNSHPQNTLAWAAWSIARLGGWNGYATERPPGPITFAHGIKRFHAMAEGFALAQHKSKNVCSR